MASIIEQVTNRTFKVEQNGQNFTFTMATYMEGLTPEIMTDKEALINWAMDSDQLYGLICEGIRGDVIKQRAICRKVDKAGDPIYVTKQMESDYQAAILEHVPATFKSETTKKTATSINAIEAALKSGKLSKDALKALLDSMTSNDEE